MSVTIKQPTAKEIRQYLNGAYKTQSVPTGSRYWERKLLQSAINKMTASVIIQGLPVTLPRSEIELSLFLTGSVVVVKKYDKLWSPFNLMPYGGNSSNAYRTSIKFVGSNPILGTFEGYDMIDGVMGYNTDVDKWQCGVSLMLETIKRYAGMLAHIESTITNSLITKRSTRAATANTSQVASALSEYLNKIEIGDTQSINTDIIGELKSVDFKDENMLSDLSQIRDYIHNCFLNEIGLQTLEEKKERMITSELDVDSDVLNNNMFSMVKNRFELISKLNHMYGLNLTLMLRG